jgi:exosome complex exonuclease DIS3/RRP44
MVCGSHETTSLSGKQRSISRILILDSTVPLHQMDFLEHPAAFASATPDEGVVVVVLRTVLDQVRQKSLSLYNRLRSLIAGKSQRDGDADESSEESVFYVFTNEFHK